MFIALRVFGTGRVFIRPGSRVPPIGADRPRREIKTTVKEEMDP